MQRTVSCQSGNTRGRKDKTRAWEQVTDVKLPCRKKLKLQSISSLRRLITWHLVYILYYRYNNFMSCDKDFLVLFKQVRFLESGITGMWQFFKGPQSATPLFLFTCLSLAIIFSSEHVETREITVRVLKIIKHTFISTTYCKKFRFCFTMQYQ